MLADAWFEKGSKTIEVCHQAGSRQLRRCPRLLVADVRNLIASFYPSDFTMVGPVGRLAYHCESKRQFETHLISFKYASPNRGSFIVHMESLDCLQLNFNDDICKLNITIQFNFSRQGFLLDFVNWSLQVYY